MPGLHRVLCLMLLALALLPEASGGVFSATLTRQQASAFAPEDPPAVSEIFHRHLGAPNPTRWARNLPGTTNAEKFLAGQAWQNVRRDILRTYGDTAGTRQHLEYREHLFRKAIMSNNKAHFRSLNTKGDLAESLMDSYYTRNGWEIVDGKRGRQGFDGLYVRRSKSGRVVDFLIADAKSGHSRLSMTQHGRQLSRRWIRHNLSELIKGAASATPFDAKRLADLEAIAALERQGRGRKPRVFSMKLEQHRGRTVYAIRHTDALGHVETATRYDMRRPGRYQRQIYRELREQIARYSPERAGRIVSRIRADIAAGRITSDSGIYSAIRNEVNDKRLAAAITQKLGDEPPRGTLAQRRGNTLLTPRSRRTNRNAAMGMLVLRGLNNGGLTMQALAQTAQDLAADVALDTATEQGSRVLANKGAQYLVAHELRKQGADASQKAISQGAARWTPALGKALGGGTLALTTLYSMGHNYHEFDAGNMSRNEMLVHVGFNAAGGVASAVLVYAAAGSSAGPVGTIVGSALGLAAVGGEMLYAHWVAQEKEERMEKEAELLAQWNSRDEQEKKQRRIAELQAEAHAQREAAWKQLLPQEPTAAGGRE